MHVTRVRFWVLALLLAIYLAGVLLLSAVTLYEPHNNGLDKKSNQQSSKKSIDYGLPGLRNPLRRSRIEWCTTLQYLNPPKSLVALASFPGSGNTWLRYLLQQATGLYTGSVYKDYGLLKNGFPAENIVNGSVLVVKTHEFGPLSRKRFAKAILLVRSPSLAIQAEFNRQSGGHIGFAPPDRYKRMKGKYWQHFVDEKLQLWKQTNLDWLYNFTGPTHIIFYEQLVNDIENTLKSVIDFLEVPFSRTLFECAVKRKEGIYKRKKRILTFDPYTSTMKAKIQSEQEKVYNAIYSFASPANS